MKIFHENKALFFYLIIPLLTIGLYGCSAWQLKVKGEKAADANEWDLAIQYYEQALEESPASKRTMALLEEAKGKSARVHYKKALAQFDKGQEHLPSVRKGLDEIGVSMRYRPSIPEYSELAGQLLELNNSLEQEIQKLVLDASRLETENAYAESFDAICMAVNIAPGDKTLQRKKGDIKEAGFSFYIEKSVMHAKNKDYHDAATALGNALHLKQSKEIARQKRQFLRMAIAKTIYEDCQAQINREKYNDVRSQLKKMVSLHPENKEYRSYLALALWEQAHGLIQDKKNEAAYDCLLELTRIDKGYKGLKQKIKQLRSELSAKFLSLENKYETSNLLGNAFLMTTYLYDRELCDSKCRTLHKNVTRILNDKAVVKIEIQPFQGASIKSKEAGMHVSGSFSQMLFSKKSTRYNLLAPENRDEYMEIQPGEDLSPKTISLNEDYLVHDLEGIFLWVSGKVDSFFVDYKRRTEPKKKKYISHYVKYPNPAYAEYQARKREEAKNSKDKDKSTALKVVGFIAETLLAPSQYIKEPVYSFYSYNVEHHEINGSMILNFQIIKSNTREILLQKTITKAFHKVDTYVPGNKEAEVENDPLEIPDEGEVQISLIDEAADASATVVLEFLQNMPRYYVGKAELALEFGKDKVADEYYARAYILDPDTINLAARLYPDRINGIGCDVDEINESIVVSSVVPGGGADDAGIETDDEIVSFNNEQILSKNQFNHALHVFTPGTICHITLKRDSKVLERFVILKSVE